MPAMKITVESDTKITSREVQTKNGKRTFFEQSCYAHITERDGTPRKYPTPIAVGVEAADKGYPPGDYEVAPQSFVAGQWGSLELGRLVLAPVGAKMQRAA